MRDAIAGTGFRERFELRMDVSRQNVPRVLGDLDIYVQPSTQEGLGSSRDRGYGRGVRGDC